MLSHPKGRLEKKPGKKRRWFYCICFLRVANKVLSFWCIQSCITKSCMILLKHRTTKNICIYLYEYELIVSLWVPHICSGSYWVGADEIDVSLLLLEGSPLFPFCFLFGGRPKHVLFFGVKCVFLLHVHAFEWRFSIANSWFLVYQKIPAAFPKFTSNNTHYTNQNS